MWPIKLAYCLFIVRKLFFFSFTVCSTSSFLTRSVQLDSPSVSSTVFQNLSRYFRSTFWNVQLSAPYNAMLQMQHFNSFFLKFKSNFMVKIVLFLLSAAVAMAILALILCVYIVSFVIMLPKDFKFSAFYSCFWSIIICTGNGSIEIFSTLLFSHIHFHSTAP